MPIPSITLPVGGAKISAAGFGNQVYTWLNFWAAPPECIVTNTAGTSIATSSETLIPFATEDFDNGASYDGAMHDTVTNNSRIVFTTAGRYNIDWALVWATNATGRRFCTVRKNAGGVPAGTMIDTGAMAGSASSTDAVTIRGHRSANFVANDYIEMFGYQSSGGALTLGSSSGIGTYMQVRLVGS